MPKTSRTDHISKIIRVDSQESKLTTPIKHQEPSVCWDDFVPCDHWRDCIAKRAQEIGRVDSSLNVIDIEGVEIPKPRKGHRVAYKNLLNEGRKIVEESEKEYTIKGVSEHFRAYQKNDNKEHALLGKRAKSEIKIPKFKSLLVIGTVNQKILEETQFLDELWSQFFRVSIEEVKSQMPPEKREHLIKVTNDLDLRFGFEDTKIQQDLINIQTVFKKYIEPFSEGSQFAILEGGLFQKRGAIRYHMIRVPDAGRVDIEFIFNMSLSRDFLTSKDRLQTSITKLSSQLPRIRLEGSEFEIIQAAFDILAGVFRVLNPETADYYVWIRLIKSRARGDVLGFYPGQEGNIEEILLQKSINSGILHEKLKKSLKKDPDEAYAICFNAALSLKAHGYCEEYWHAILWNNCFEHLKDQRLADPAFNALFEMQKEKRATFDQIVALLQIKAFLFPGACKIRKDGSVPIFQYRFHQAHINLPMISEETILKFYDFAEKQKLPESLFSEVKFEKPHPFFKEYQHHFKWPQFNATLLDHNDGKTALIGFALNAALYDLDAESALKEVVPSPRLLQIAKEHGCSETLLAAMKTVCDEPIFKGDDFQKWTFIYERAKSPHPILREWSLKEWSELDFDEKIEKIEEYIPALSTYNPEKAFEILSGAIRKIDPQKGFEILVSLYRCFDVETSQCFAFQALDCARKAQIEEISVLMPSLLRILSNDPQYLTGDQMSYVCQYSKNLDDDSKTLLFQGYKRLLEGNIECCLTLLSSNSQNISADYFAITVDWLIKKSKNRKNKVGKYWTTLTWSIIDQHKKGKISASAVLSICRRLCDHVQVCRVPLINLQKYLLETFKQGKINDPDTCEQIFRNVQRHLKSFKKPHAELQRLWVQLVPKLFEERSPFDVLRLWRAFTGSIKISPSVMSLICQAYVKVVDRSYSDIEFLLLQYFDYLPKGDQENFIQQSLHFYLVQKDQAKSLEFGRFGKVPESICELIEQELFEEALALFENQEMAGVIWRKRLKDLIANNRINEAVKVIFHHDETFQSQYELEQFIYPFLEKGLSDPAFQSLLMSLCKKRQITSIEIIRPLILSITLFSEIKLCRQMWDFLITALFVQKHISQEKKVSLELFQYASTVVAMTSPSTILKNLKDPDLLAEMDRQNYLDEYLEVALCEAGEQLKLGKKEPILDLENCLKDARLNPLLHETFFLKVFSLLIKHPQTKNSACSFVEARMCCEESILSDEEVQGVIQVLLSLSKKDDKVLSLLERLVGNCFTFSDNGNGGTFVHCRSLDIDYRQLFSAISRKYHKPAVIKSHGQAAVTFPEYDIRDNFVTYWDWFWSFLVLALNQEGEESDEFIEQASQFLANSLKYEKGRILLRFVNNKIKTRSESIDWVIFTHAVKKVYTHDLNHFNEVLTIFTPLKEQYLKVQQELPSSVKGDLLVILLTCSCIRFMAYGTFDSFCDEVKLFEELFFTLECFDVKLCFVRGLYNQKEFFFNSVKKNEAAFPLAVMQGVEHLETKLRGLMNGLATSILSEKMPDDSSRHDLYWESIAEAYKIFCIVDPKLYKNVTTSFEIKKIDYLKTRKNISLKTKKLLLSKLIETSLYILKVDDDQRRFRDYHEFLEETFVHNQEGGLAFHFARKLWCLKSSIPVTDGKECYFPLAHQYIADRMFHYIKKIMQIYAPSKQKNRKGQIPPNSALICLAGFFGYRSNLITITGEKEDAEIRESLSKALEKQEIFLREVDTLIKRIPKSWIRSYEQLILSESDKINLQDRLSCLFFLESQNHPSLLQCYEQFMKYFSRKAIFNQDLSLPTVLDFQNQLFDRCLGYCGRHLKKKKEALKFFKSQIAFFQGLRKEFLNQQVKMNQSIERVNGSEWVSSSSMVPVLLEETKGMQGNINEMDLIYLRQISKWPKHIIRLNLSVHDEQSVHKEIIHYLKDHISRVPAPLLPNPLFITAVLNLQVSNRTKKMSGLYYSVIQSFFTHLYFLDIKNGSKAKGGTLVNSYLEMLANYRKWVDVNIYESKIRGKVLQAISVFIDGVFKQFKTDFPAFHDQVCQSFKEKEKLDKGHFS